jgi:xanthosine utilization system XapX-like protein
MAGRQSTALHGTNVNRFQVLLLVSGCKAPTAVNCVYPLRPVPEWSTPVPELEFLWGAHIGEKVTDVVKRLQAVHCRTSSLQRGSFLKAAQSQPARHRMISSKTLEHSEGVMFAVWVDHASSVLVARTVKSACCWAPVVARFRALNSLG